MSCSGQGISCFLFPPPHILPSPVLVIIVPDGVTVFIFVFKVPFQLSLFLSCIGEGNGNPLQCSCLENPRDGGACWAAVYGVAESDTEATV